MTNYVGKKVEINQAILDSLDKDVNPVAVIAFLDEGKAVARLGEGKYTTLDLEGVVVGDKFTIDLESMTIVEETLMKRKEENKGTGSSYGSKFAF